MLQTAQFNVSWWFRTTFDVPSTSSGGISESKSDSALAIQTALLRFQGLNYRANIWCNGVQLASERNTAGSFVYFDYDITALLQPSNNVVAVELWEPWDTWTPSTNNSTDLAISFVDWAPFAPDMSMGLWRNVALMLLPGSVSLDYPLVDTQLSWSSGSMPQPTAHLTVMAQLTNYANVPVAATLAGSILGVCNFSQPVSLKPYETRQVFFTNASFPVLNIGNPNLWWPWQMGPATLHNLTLTLTLPDGRVLDYLNTAFGIRQVTSALDSQQSRVYSVNGQRILIRGAGWAPDLFLRAPRERLEVEMTYVRHMNLNTIRLEGKMYVPSSTFYLSHAHNRSISYTIYLSLSVRLSVSLSPSFPALCRVLSSFVVVIVVWCTFSLDTSLSPYLLFSSSVASIGITNLSLSLSLSLSLNL